MGSDEEYRLSDDPQYAIERAYRADSITGPIRLPVEPVAPEPAEPKRPVTADALTMREAILMGIMSLCITAILLVLILR